MQLPFADLQATIEQAGFAELAVSIAHALGVRDLPHLHRDPFDRLLVAQAIDESLTLVSGNTAIGSYPVQILWA